MVVTKAEHRAICKRSGNSKSIYIRLFRFGVRSLCFGESGLYEANYLLLGDHLAEKSNIVKWVNIVMSHKRSRRLKNHILQEKAKHNPYDKAIFGDDVFYPHGPAQLEDVCLYDSLPSMSFKS